MSVSLKEAFGKPARLFRPVLIVGIYLACWLALDAVSSLFKVDQEVTVWSPQAGLSFVLLFVFGLRYWPALLLNTPLHVIFVSSSPLSVWQIAFFDVAETAIYAGAAFLLVRAININPGLKDQRDIAWFVGVACLAAPLLVASTIVPVLTATAYLDRERAW